MGVILIFRLRSGIAALLICSGCRASIFAPVLKPQMVPFPWGIPKREICGKYTKAVNNVHLQLSQEIHGVSEIRKENRR
jgi:hypothetical protein